MSYVIEIDNKKINKPGDIVNLVEWFEKIGYEYNVDYNWTSTLYTLRIRIDDPNLATLVRLTWE
jgi:hypothetical protein